MSRPCVLVLGMHRSGTTAAAAALHHLGFTMGHDLYGPNEWNAKGYYEDAPFVRFDDVLLALMRRRWDSPLPPEPGDFRVLCDKQPQALEMVRSRDDSSAHWGIKDPRLCLLEPFWSDVLYHAGVNARFLLTVRQPAYVAKSLARRDGIGGTRAAWLWFAHVAGALQYVKRPGVAKFITFDDLIERPAACCQALATWLGHSPLEPGIASFATDFIAPTLAHRNDVDLPDMPPLLDSAFQMLLDAATRDLDPFDFAASDAWLATLSDFQRQALPTLRIVQGFFGSDRQLDVYDSRISALSCGLATARQLAAERLSTLAALDEQLRRTTAAFAHAEKLAIERFDEVKVLTQQIHRLQSAPPAAEQGL